MAAPNTQTQSNPAVLAGGQFGAIVGSPADAAGLSGPAATVGFYGLVGVAQQSGGSITTVAELVAALQAVGLLGA